MMSRGVNSCSMWKILVKSTMGFVPFACQKESCSWIQKFNKKNLSRVPKEISDNAFYLRAFAKPRGEVWYHYKFNGKRNVRIGTKENHDKARILRGISQTILLGEVPPRDCTKAV